MIYALGFLIALAIGITGVGGGTITVPVLMLFVHLAPDKTVGTALAFAAACEDPGRAGLLGTETGQLSNSRIDAAGRLAGTFCRALFPASLAFVESELAAYGFVGDRDYIDCRDQHHARQQTGSAGKRRDHPRLLPWIMLPIGAEVGFSSAGAGAIGTLALLNLTKLTPVQVVGTDVVFGLALSLLGGGIQMATGSYDPTILRSL